VLQRVPLDRLPLPPGPRPSFAEPCFPVRPRLPLRRDSPSGRDLDDGTVSQLLEELAGEMNRPSDRKRRISGNDIYSLLVEATPDRGKETRASLDWSEPELLRDMLKRRLVYNGLDRKASFDELWRMIAISLVDGEESSEYLIERSMMRPRFLLNLLSHCRGYAINLGHDKIQADDIRRGLDAFSTDLIYDIDLEIRDVLPFAEDVLYTFFGQSALLSEQDVNVLLSQRFNIAQRQKLVNILLWYGVIGVIRQDGSEAFIYSVNYDMKRLTALLHLVPPEQRAFCINPAFWLGLEINTQARLI
jgi:hypothetical protein